jgi:TetR/AcrR family transcriptional repressor of nem operon
VNSARDKRERLAAAAAVLLHRQGFAHTTRADIADEAKVALGSVYYYFRTKDDVARAILERRQSEIGRALEGIDRSSDPLKRLEALVGIWVNDRDIDARYGCPIGSLCYELAKGRGPLSSEASAPFRTLLAWCEKQFRLLGKSRQRAAALALHMVASLQGISLIANALGDPDTILTDAKFLTVWLRNV